MIARLPFARTKKSKPLISAVNPAINPPPQTQPRVADEEFAHGKFSTQTLSHMRHVLAQLRLVGTCRALFELAESQFLLGKMGFATRGRSNQQREGGPSKEYPQAIFSDKTLSHMRQRLAHCRTRGLTICVRPVRANRDVSKRSHEGWPPPGGAIGYMRHGFVAFETRGVTVSFG
jgi:hypothetical protein